MAETYKYFSKSDDKKEWYVFPGLCKGCGLCMEMCPVDVLVWSDELGVYQTPIIDNADIEKCTGCGMCQNVCPDCAILVQRKVKTTA